MPAADSNARVQELRSHLDNATLSMKDNMALLAEREEAMTSLEGKSSNLSRTATKFHQGARMVSWKTKAAGYTAAIIISVIFLWTVFYILHVHVHKRNIWEFLGLSALLFLVAFGVYAFLKRRWSNAADQLLSDSSSSSSDEEMGE
mmetsp:Transcript_9901/g.21760  ORF Transcript_9901/g.21760 Transcript_9901/m.21760 type:complete len:146 (+) Transcript_9901:224-661(+)